MFSSQKGLFMFGLIATYAKIALGMCQLSAMLEIRAQMKLHIRR